jgi:GT2 family glycosyltransferase
MSEIESSIHQKLMMDTRAYILVLNWNGWHDTLECLESVFRIDYPDFHVVVCDNDSEDNSVERFVAWADGRLDTVTFPDNCLKPLSWPPVQKPISYAVRSREELERHPSLQADTRLTIIRTGDNLGFAGGNNVGLRYIMAQECTGCIWLLNNDTVVKEDALSCMIRRMSEKESAGMCGSTLLYYDKPDLVQALGGAYYNRFLGSNFNIGKLSPRWEPIDIARVEEKISYVIGASMLVTRSFIERIGLMNESYFHFFEELDWSVRAKGKFSIAYAPDSIVYHKEGSSLGTASTSAVIDYYALRNRIVFTRTYYPILLPGIYLGLLVAIVNRLRRKQLVSAVQILQLMFKNGWNKNM